MYVEVGGEHIPAGSKSGFAARYKDSKGIWRVKIKRDAKGNEQALVTVADQNSKKLKKRAEVIQRAVIEVGSDEGFTMPPADQPLAVICTFYKPHNKGHYGTGRNADVLKPTAPAFPIAPPDATKLWRGFEDALTGVLWHDDSRVVGQFISQEFVERWEPHLTRFSLYSLPATVAELRAVGGDPVQDSLLASA
jgi:hypothetical protein